MKFQAASQLPSERTRRNTSVSLLCYHIHLHAHFAGCEITSHGHPPSFRLHSLLTNHGLVGGGGGGGESVPVYICMSYNVRTCTDQPLNSLVALICVGGSKQSTGHRICPLQIKLPCGFFVVALWFRHCTKLCKGRWHNRLHRRVLVLAHVLQRRLIAASWANYDVLSVPKIGW